MLRHQQQCSFWSVLLIQPLLTLSMSLSELSLEILRGTWYPRRLSSVCKQWTRQLKRFYRISEDHEIFANPSAEQAHPSEHFNPSRIAGSSRSVAWGLTPGGTLQWFLSLFWCSAYACMSRGGPAPIFVNTSLNPTPYVSGILGQLTQLVQLFLINAIPSL